MSPAAAREELDPAGRLARASEQITDSLASHGQGEKQQQCPALGRGMGGR